MGLRLYDSVSGRFLSRDPVKGGNDNAYIYPADPVNQFDLDGAKVKYKKYKAFHCWKYDFICKTRRKLYAKGVGNAAMIWALSKGGRCGKIRGLRTCWTVWKWTFVPGTSGTTFGNRYLTWWSKSRLKNEPDLIRHEKEHVRQWQRYGVWFPYLYAKEGANPCNNYFEKKADLIDGGYKKQCGL